MERYDGIVVVVLLLVVERVGDVVLLPPPVVPTPTILCTYFAANTLKKRVTMVGVLDQVVY